MSTIRTWTAAQCIEQIDALEAKRVELLDVPRSGSVGKTSINLAGMSEDIRAEIDLWRSRLVVAQGGARGRWGC